MSPTGGTMPGAGRRFPRVSGDEPGERDPIERYGVFSPHERGWPIKLTGQCVISPFSPRERGRARHAEHARGRMAVFPA